MSTSLLYHAFGVRGYRYVKTEYVEGKVIFTIEQPRESYRCPACGSEAVIGRGQNVRRFRTVPMGSKSAYLALAIPRVECRDCGVVRQMKLGFADPRVSYTKAFERYALELSRYMTIKDVADHLGISWDVIKEIQKAHLKRRFDRPKLRHLRQIAVDEISTAKGHVYLTIVLDLESGAVVHVGQGKGGDALKEFWSRLRRSGAKVEAVATDMSPAYIDAVTTFLPGTRLVFDRFHVIKLYNDKLSELRRALYHQFKDTMQKDGAQGGSLALAEAARKPRSHPQRAPTPSGSPASE
jgi:transposase